MHDSEQSKGDRDISEARADHYDLEEPYVWPKERPLGVTVIALLNWLGATILAFVMLIVWMLMSADSEEVQVYFQWDDRRLFSVDNVSLFLVFSTIIIALSVLISIGLWKLKAWVRKVAIGFYGLWFAALVWNELANPVTGAVLAVVLFALGSIIYLMQPSVRAIFEA